MKGLSNITIALGLVLTMTVFFHSVSAYADKDGSHADPQTTAQQADSANDEETMRNFVLHAKRHVDAAAADPTEIAVLYRQMRQEGDWRHGSVYLIVLRMNGGVVNHGKYTKSLYGDSLASLSTVGELLTALRNNGQGGPVCVEYSDTSGDPKTSCAVLSDSAIGVQNVLIGGFDHDENHQGISSLDCSSIEQPEVTAQDVDASQYVSEKHSLETLEAFVKGAITTMRKEVVRSREAVTRLACLGKAPWKSGSIYLFVMLNTPGGVPQVIVNGNNPELTGINFENVFDEDGVDIGEEILKVAKEDGEGDFVRYKWDNPLIEQDDVFEVGMSPGRSPKISYVEAAKIIPGNERIFIVGSGIYKPLEADSGSSDDGCAIAGGTASLGGTLFNLVLIVFSLCLAFLVRGPTKRAKRILT